jgi:TRAP-type uncharacterized transport system substrate-binding protein
MKKMLMLAFGLLLLGGLGATAYVFLRSYTMTIRLATVAQGPESTRAIQSIARVLSAENAWITFQRVPVSSYEEGAKAVATGLADLAIVRSDMEIPAQAQTLAILQRDRIFLIAPPKTNIESFRDLRRQTIGMLDGAVSNDALLDRILTFYGVEPGQITRLPVKAAEAGQFLQRRRAVAILAVGTPDKSPAIDAFSAVEKAFKAAPGIIGIDEAEAMSERMPFAASGEIAIGAFKGRHPGEAITTLTVAYHLIVPRSMSNIVAGELARLIFLIKRRLAGDPAFVSLEIPDTEQRNFEIHPGAKAYFNDEVPSLFDRFESLFWISWTLIAVFGAGLSWGLSHFWRNKEEEREEINAITTLLAGIPKADATQLDVLQGQIDSFVSNIIKDGGSGEYEAKDIALYALALNQAREAIHDRRSALAKAAAA